MNSLKETLSAYRLRLNLGDGKQTARLVSGIVLFLFVLTHFLNHGLGIFSQDLMEKFQIVRSGFWRSMRHPWRNLPPDLGKIHSKTHPNPFFIGVSGNCC